VIENAWHTRARTLMPLMSLFEVKKMHLHLKFIELCITLSTKRHYCESDFPILKTSVFDTIFLISETVLRILLKFATIMPISW